MGSETHLTQRYFDKEKTVKEYENRRTRHTKRKNKGRGWLEATSRTTSKKTLWKGRLISWGPVSNRYRTVYLWAGLSRGVFPCCSGRRLQPFPGS
ncbi:MAG: hypothetical protein QXU87_05445, partial [Candidatus Caldarchaeum sp.]